MMTPQQVKEVLDNFNARIQDVEGEYRITHNKIVTTNKRINKLQQQIEKFGNAFAKFTANHIREIARLKEEVQKCKSHIKR